MASIELSEKERQILERLAKGGTMSPSQVSVETMILPGETAALLKSLSDGGLVQVREDTESVDGKLVSLTADAYEFLGMSNSARQNTRGFKSYYVKR